MPWIRLIQTRKKLIIVLNICPLKFDYDNNLGIFFQDRVKDDWLANKMLRDAFRATKKERKAQLAKDKLITDKCGLELDLVPEEDEDVRMAR